MNVSGNVSRLADVLLKLTRETILHERHPQVESNLETRRHVEY